ncbi:MAG: tRNA pseudouridine(38-40) synthase TruA [Flavobacteriales bacterium]|jgi:tRNA pseudouridine38-40 synthase|nr:tRNA pseudouridine(38-40) synthase TruA [Flavobacteriales bacterium]
MRYFIEFSYNGTNYHGWQKQPNANTVQEQLTKCMSVLLKEEVELMGASRTDTGVHAKQMFAHLDTSTTLNSDKIVTKLNSFLPSDISVVRIFNVKEDTHVRFAATSRTYKYYVSSKKDIFNNNLHLVFKPLDVHKMNAACAYLLGEQDFTSFSKVNTDTFTNNCDITKAVWEKEGDNFVFTVSANRFLRNMVRSVVGTLLDVGIGKIEVEEVKTIIAKKDRGAAGTSVPAKALFLTEIKYPKDI